MSVITSFPGVLFVKKMGINFSIKIAMIFLIIGFVCKAMINQNFYFAILGQGIIGLVLPLINNIQQQFASNWFGPQQVKILQFFIEKKKFL